MTNTIDLTLKITSAQVVETSVTNLTVLFRTTLTRTITLYELTIVFLLDTPSIQVECKLTWLKFVLCRTDDIFSSFLIPQEKISIAEDYFGSGGIFSITVYSGLSLFVVLMAAGIGWEMYRKTRKKNQSAGEGKDQLNVSPKINILSEEDGKIKTH